MTAERLDIAQLQQLGKGTTAEVYRLPSTGKVLKVFPTNRWIPTALSLENGLHDLLYQLQQANVPMIPGTEVVQIAVDGYSPQAAIMDNVSGNLQGVGKDVLDKTEAICIKLSEIIGTLHAHGIVIDPFEKGKTSSHIAPQLFAIFHKVEGEVAVFDWTNLALASWFENEWINEMKRDLIGQRDFSLLFSGGWRRLNLKHYQETFRKLCQDEDIKVEHKKMIAGLMGLYL